VARSEGSEPEELEEPEDGSEDLEDLDEDDAALTLPGDEEEGEEASLDELLAQRAAPRRAADEPEEDNDIMALASERDVPVIEPLPTRIVPIKDRQEFVCNSCHLVKARSQFADEGRGFCRDCV